MRVSIRHASKVYRYGALELHALRDVCVDVGDGEFVCITGPSGAGKSTLLGIIGLLDTPTRGECKVDGLDAARLSDSQRSRLRRERVGFVFERPRFIADQSILDNCALVLRYRGFGEREARSRAARTMKALGLSQLEPFFPNQLSGGELVQASIARALAGEPDLLVADEPLASLDADSREGVSAVIERLNARGVTVIVAGHAGWPSKRTIELAFGQLV